MLAEYLSSMKIFEALTDSEIAALAGIALYKNVEKNTHLFHMGEEMTSFFFVVRGNVKIYRIDEEGREQIINFFGEREMFPHHAIFRADPYPASAMTTEKSEIIVIDKAEFEDLVRSQPDIAVKLFKYIGEIIIDLQHRLQEKILKPTDEQVLLLIRRLAHAHGLVLGDGRREITLKLTKQEMASMIGLTRETVSRNISMFRKIGIIDIDGAGRMIVDLEELETYL